MPTTNSSALVVAQDQLVRIGFTELEARLYCELVRRGPSTGYKLAQAIGKAAANVYQALGVLVLKGAAMSDESGNAVVYAAVAPEIVIGALRRDFEQRSNAAVDALAELGNPVSEERQYSLENLDHVYETARSLIRSARQILIFDLFPLPLRELCGDLEEAVRRGVDVAGLVYEQPDNWPFTGVRAGATDVVTERWPGLQLSLVADASQYLLALLSRDGTSVERALWSDSPYLACLQHSGLSAEVRLWAGPGDPLARIGLLKAMPPGLEQLFASKSGVQP